MSEAQVSLHGSEKPKALAECLLETGTGAVEMHNSKQGLVLQPQSSINSSQTTVIASSVTHKRLSAILFVIVCVILLGWILIDSSSKLVQQNLPEASYQFELSNQKDKLSVPEVEGCKHSPSPSHNDGKPTFPYPTMGVPIPGQTFNDTLVRRRGFAAFDSEVNELFKPYNDTDCEFVKYGETEDGSYLVCKNYLDKSEAFLNLGINGFDDLGCQITTTFPMPNYQYDCTNPTVTVCDTNKGANVFNFVCVGEKTERTKEFTYYTLEDMLKIHKLEGKRITLKIDCEGCEIPGFKYFPVKYLDYIDQILMELHFSDINPERWGNLEIYRTLASKFVNVNYHVPYWLCHNQREKTYRRLPGKTIEVTLINKNLIKFKSQSRSFALNPLNFRACPPPA